MRNVRVVEPSGEHKVTALLLPGFTGSVDELIPWFQRLGEPLDTRSAAAEHVVRVDVAASQVDRRGPFDGQPAAAA